MKEKIWSQESVLREYQDNMKHYSGKTIKEQDSSACVLYELCYQRHPSKQDLELCSHLLSVTDLECNCLHKSQLGANIFPSLSPLTMNEARV